MLINTLRSAEQNIGAYQLLIIIAILLQKTRRVIRATRLATSIPILLIRDRNYITMVVGTGQRSQRIPLVLIGELEQAALCQI